VTEGAAHGGATLIRARLRHASALAARGAPFAPPVLLLKIIEWMKRAGRARAVGLDPAWQIEEEPLDFRLLRGRITGIEARRVREVDPRRVLDELLDGRSMRRMEACSSGRGAEPQEDAIKQGSHALLGALNNREALACPGHIDQACPRDGAPGERTPALEGALGEQRVEGRDHGRAARVVEQLIEVEARAAWAAPIVQGGDRCAREARPFERDGQPGPEHVGAPADAAPNTWRDVRDLREQGGLEHERVAAAGEGRGIGVKRGALRDFTRDRGAFKEAAHRASEPLERGSNGLAVERPLEPHGAGPGVLVRAGEVVIVLRERAAHAGVLGGEIGPRRLGIQRRDQIKMARHVLEVDPHRAPGRQRRGAEDGPYRDVDAPGAELPHAL